MDIESLKKNAKIRYDAEKMKQAVAESIKEYRDTLSDVQYERRELFEPIITSQKEIKKSTDEKQDKLIEKLKENQNQIVKAVMYDPKKAITYDGSQLPTLDWDEDEGVEKAEKHDASGKEKTVIDLDMGISKEYMQLLEDKGLEKPSKLLNKLEDIDSIKTK